MAREFIEFEGRKFYRMSGGYYKGDSGWLHRAVWTATHGEIPDGCEIHHRDFNPSNNAIENLQCVTIAEHKMIHAAVRPKHIHVCENCGKTYEARNYTKKNRFCSNSCHKAFLRKQGYYDVERKCAFCGKIFVTRKDYKARYCSNSCAKKANPNKRGNDRRFLKKDEK